MKFLSLLLPFWVFSCVSCGNITPDITDSYANKNYFNIEFDAKMDNNSDKWMGTVPVMLYENSDISKQSISMYGVYKGTTVFKSVGCSADYSLTYNGQTSIPLSNFMNTPTNCIITLTNETETAKGVQTNIVENGKIDVFVVKKGLEPISFSFNKTTSFGQKTYATIGNSSMQIPEGGVTFSQTIDISSSSSSGLYAINSDGCPKIPVVQGVYKSNKFQVSLRQMYGKGIVNYDEDSCNFNFTLTPSDRPNAIVGKMSINVYKNTVVPLEYANWRIYKWAGKNYLEASGFPHIIATGINDTVSALIKKNKSNASYVKYDPNTEYTIRAITINGRKSVFKIKNNKVIWW